MKTKWILFLLLCISIGSHSQSQSTEVQSFFNQLKSLDEMKTKALETNDFKRAEASLGKMIKIIDKASPEQKKELNPTIQGSLYYDLACAVALQKNKKKAAQYFRRAYENGFDNYQHTIKDSDLNCIRQEKDYLITIAKMKEGSDYPYILKKAAPYRKIKTDTLPQFSYMNPNDPNLVRVRQYFNLDSVAGAGNEISKIKNLLAFIHNTIRHDGGNDNPSPRNAIAMAQACKDGSRGLNCRGLATVLNECYLAMGFKSRIVTCMPKVYTSDCHVINTVYSNTLDKWIWVDPTFNAYVTDENGTLLGIAEVRERLRNEQPLAINEDANWNHQYQQTKERYLDQYMAKNLYYIDCQLRSEFDAETNWKGWEGYISLMPDGFTTPDCKSYWQICDDQYFWQSPYQN